MPVKLARKNCTDIESAAKMLKSFMQYLHPYVQTSVSLDNVILLFL